MAGGEALAEVHEFLGNAFLALVLGHLGGVAGLSALRRRNVALPMLTGRIAGSGPHLVRHDRRALAPALAAAVLVFVVWQDAQAPAGLLPSASASARSHAGDDDD